MKRRQRSILLTLMFMTSIFIGFGFMIGAPSLLSTTDSMDLSTDAWNITWRYRLNVSLQENGGVARAFYPVDIDVNFSSGECINNSIRVRDDADVEIPSQVWDVNYYTGTSYISTAKVTFLVNISSMSTKEYQILYSDLPDPFPEPDYSAFASGLNASFDGEKVTVVQEYYSIEFAESNGVYNFTLNALGENYHTNDSLSPDLYDNFPIDNQYLYLLPNEHLIFIAQEAGDVRIYDGETNSLIAQHTFTENEVWRYPDTTEQYFHNLLSTLVRIDSDIEGSMYVTSDGLDNIHGGGGITNNYYSGMDHRSDDGLYSSYGTDLLLWVPRDLYITAYEPTEVIITDLDADDGDSDDSKTIILGDPSTPNGYYLGWNTSMNSLIYTADQYNSFYPVGDPSGDDEIKPDIFDNDIVHIKSNSAVSIIGGYCANSYQTEVMGKNGLEFHFPILYRFFIVATEDNTQIHFSNLSTTGEKLRPYVITNDISAYRSNFDNYNDRRYLTTTEYEQQTVYDLMAGDTIEFWDWPPDRNRTTGNYNYDSDAGSNIYDRWSVAPDFYKNNWANVTSTKPIRVYVSTSPGNDINRMESTDFAYIAGTRAEQTVTVVGLEDDTSLTLKSSEDATEPLDHRFTIVESVDINQDGIDEAIVGSLQIMLYNLSDNSEMWNEPIDVWANSYYGMGRTTWNDMIYQSEFKFANLTGDDYLDVLVSVGTTGLSTQSLQAIDGKTGEQLWHKDHYLYGPTNFEVGDINNDGLDDVVAVGYSQRRLVAYNSTNGEYLMYQYIYQGYGEGISLVDQDGDNYYEALILAASNNQVYTYNMSNLLYTSYWSTFYNKPGWSYARTSLSSVYSDIQAFTNDFRTLEVSDLDGDGTPEIIIGKGNEDTNSFIDVYTYDPATLAIGALNYTINFQTDLVGYEYNRHRPYIIETSDINGDSVKDLIVGMDRSTTAYIDSTVFAFNGLNGAHLWNSTTNITEWVTDIEVVDLDVDGEKEVIVGTAENLYTNNVASGWLTKIGNVTILNSSDGTNLWWNVTEEGWVRTVKTAQLDANNIAILATTFTDQPQLHIYKNQTNAVTSYVNQTSITLERYGYDREFNLDEGDVIQVQIQTARRGFQLNSSKPVYYRYSAGASSESIVWMPLKKRPQIETITVLDSGPVFVKFNVEWTTSDGFHTTDNFTFYNTWPMWKLSRQQYSDTARTIEPALINTLYDIPLANELNVPQMTQVVDGAAPVAVTLPQTATTSVVIQDNNLFSATANTSIGLYMIDKSSNLAGAQLESQDEQTSGLTEIKLVINAPLTLSGSSDTIEFELWEGIMPNQTSTTLTGMHTAIQYPLIFAGSTIEEQWVEFELTVVNKDGLAVEGANVTVINVTRLNASYQVEEYNYSEIVGVDGRVTGLTRILEGDYLVNVTFIDQDSGIFNTSEQLIINANSTLAPSPISLDLVSFDIQAVYESARKSMDQILDEDYLENALVNILNYTSGTSLVNLTTNDDGEISFICQSYDNYSVMIEAFGQGVKYEAMEEVFAGQTNLSSATVVVGTEETAKNINVSDDTYWDISSEAGTNTTQIELEFNLNYTWVISSFVLMYEGFLNSTLNGTGTLQVWDYEASDWSPDIINLNSNLTYYNTTQEYDYRHVDTTDNNKVLVQLNLQSNDTYKLSVDLLAMNVTTISGNNNSLTTERAFDLTNSKSVLLNCTGLGPLPDTALTIVVPSNFTDPWTVEYHQNLNITTQYNVSDSGAIDPDSSTASVVIKGTTTTVIDSLALTPTGTTGETRLLFNTSDYLSGGIYIVTITTSKQGYLEATTSFELNVSNLIATLDSPSYISAFYTFNGTVNISYVANSIDLSNWTLTYYIDNSELINGTVFVTDSLLDDGNYNLTFTTPGLNQGFHNLIITGAKENYTTYQDIISLEIKGLPTLVNGSNSDFDATQLLYIESTQIYYFQFNDSVNEVGIDDLDTLSWTAKLEGVAHDSGNLEALGDGLYKLDFNTGNRGTGNYTIWVTFFKNNYEIKKAVIFLEIELIPVDVDFSASLITVDQGSNGLFSLQLNDIYGQPIIGAIVNYIWAYGSNNFTDVGAGVYTLSIGNTRSYSIGTHSITYTITLANHTQVTGTLVVNIDYYKFFGIIPEPIFWAILVTAIIAVAAVSMYVGIKRKRIPFEIKKIDETIKGIQKEKSKLPYPVLKTKAEIYEGMFGANWAVIDQKPPLKGKKAVQDDFIDLISSIKKIRMTAYEAETLKARLVTLSNQEAMQLLAEMGIPPDTAERIIKLAKK